MRGNNFGSQIRATCDFHRRIATLIDTIIPDASDGIFGAIATWLAKVYEAGQLLMLYVLLEEPNEYVYLGVYTLVSSNRPWTICVSKTRTTNLPTGTSERLRRQLGHEKNKTWDRLKK